MAASTNLNQSLLLALFVFCVVWASAASSSTIDDLPMSVRHELWMAQYGRVYKDQAEKEHRFQIFKGNVEYIDSANRAATERKYMLDANQFADMTKEEVKASRNGFNFKKPGHAANASTNFRYRSVSDVPSAMDWRANGAVTPIKDQGQCGCCWAFSAVASTEGINQITTGKLVSLSEQEVVSCDVNGRDQGCHGGLPDGAFQFIVNNGGLTTEADYPYEGADGTCNNPSVSAQPAASISGYEYVPTNSESSLLSAAANQPVSVGIDASGSDFHFYSAGVFTGQCGTDLDHAVTVVGYGTASDGTKYWLVKNSWGTKWGEEGYVRMQRDVEAAEGLCGIAMRPSYPTA